MNKAGKTYMLQFGAAMVIFYPLALVASIALLQRYPGSEWRVLFALLPVIPPLFGLLAFVRFLGQMDELQRRIQFEGISLSFGVTLFVAMTAGFLENAGLPRLSWIFVVPLMIGLWGIGTALATRRYR